MSDMRRVRVARSAVAAKLAEGYRMIKGKGLDGNLWEGGDAIMEIEEDRYRELYDRRLAPYKMISESIRRGRAPVAMPTEEGVTAEFSVQEVKNKSDVEKGE